MGAAPKWMRWLPGVALVAAAAVLFLPGFASLRSTSNGAGPPSPENPDVLMPATVLMFPVVPSTRRTR